MSFKSATIVGLVLLGLAFGAHASPIPATCASQADFTSAAPLGERDVFFNFAGTFSGLTAPATSTFACLQSDKIFSDFHVTAGEIPPDLGLEMDLGSFIGFDVHTLNFQSANFSTGFSISYSVEVSGSSERIFKVTGGLLDSPSLAPATLTKRVDGAGGFTGSVSTSSSGSTAISVPLLSSLQVTDVFLPGGGGVTNVANSFFESRGDTPDPPTTALLGGGLIALGLVRRRIRASISD